MFFVGQKVVCVEGPRKGNSLYSWTDWDFDEYKGQGPIVGTVYTIREIAIYPNVGTGLRLVELPMPVAPDCSPGDEICFRIERFRPVVERKTDIGVFTAILDRANRKVDA